MLLATCRRCDVIIEQHANFMLLMSLCNVMDICCWSGSCLDHKRVGSRHTWTIVMVYPNKTLKFHSCHASDKYLACLICFLVRENLSFVSLPSMIWSKRQRLCTRVSPNYLFFTLCLVFFFFWKYLICYLETKSIFLNISYFSATINKAKHTRIRKENLSKPYYVMNFP